MFFMPAEHALPPPVPDRPCTRAILPICPEVWPFADMVRLVMSDNVPRIDEEIRQTIIRRMLEGDPPPTLRQVVLGRRFCVQRGWLRPTGIERPATNGNLSREWVSVLEIEGAQLCY